MNTPIADFVGRYVEKRGSRFHMPGHKGRPVLGCEPLDITEIPGADALYEASGIIAESEAHAAAVFGSRRTFYSTEGSSHCIRAMLYLAATASRSRTVVAARNVHRAFISAAALLDLEVIWLWPEESRSLCGCQVSPEALEKILNSLPAPPAAVYLTSPDYLGAMADIPGIAEVCHRHGVLLAVDNAHGAYLHFLTPPSHPLDLGADLCCDSAHKTLPVLTGGAYLHIARRHAPAALADRAREALALFGSTSPSYLTLASLDLCNRYLENVSLRETVNYLTCLRRQLAERGWQVECSDPLRLTIAAPDGLTGLDLAQRLRERQVECEYADRDFLVLMVTPENVPADFARLLEGLGRNKRPPAPRPLLPLARGEQVLSIRQALFSPQETVPAETSLGRICGAPAVSCPPAVPVAVGGERIGREAVELFARYGIELVAVVKDSAEAGFSSCGKV